MKPYSFYVLHLFCNTQYKADAGKCSTFGPHFISRDQLNLDVDKIYLEIHT